MKKIIIVSIIFIFTQFTVRAQSQKIWYILPDSVEVRLNRYILTSIPKQEVQKLFFLLKRDSLNSYNITVIPLTHNTDLNIIRWVEDSNRYVLVNKNLYPLLLDYDFIFGTPEYNNIGEFGQREGSIKKIYLIPHRYTIYFKMNGSVLKEENW
ncbi:hypothetical protein GA0116948_1297 [Chitinophaga costaii]|uniref:Uncharacterized protein n=1 Tax=Chitinophaga costaii TaxID=1335309 RepID=A0A1C4G984_9BACT|nr:hypothetical protein [Chitinophaga costaii]PUZ19328.1 hypothetical protein DCM91_20660 [Chitinophaga costaii]SCC64311.1 hypothetical protein GA0116948_1297 [Chitinophaga costaii]